MSFQSPLFLLVPMLALGGCASQKTLDTQLDPVGRQLDEVRLAQASLAAAQQKMETRLSRLEGDSAIQASRLSLVEAAGTEAKRELDSLRGQAVSTQSGLTALAGKVDTQAVQLAQARETADDAIKIARDSRSVAGKVVNAVTLTQDMVSYSYEQPALTATGKAALDALIASTRPLMPQAFIEIIGYTDDLSLNSQNHRVALERAESVRRYLHEVGGIQLHRMSSISYGDLKPVASNISPEGRGQNRRVVVQVLK